MSKANGELAHINRTLHCKVVATFFDSLSHLPRESLHTDEAGNRAANASLWDATLSALLSYILHNLVGVPLVGTRSGQAQDLPLQNHKFQLNRPLSDVLEVYMDMIASPLGVDRAWHVQAPP
jgi:hypothetical protein